MKPNTAPPKWDDETWKHVCKRRWQWAVLFPQLAKQSVGMVGLAGDIVEQEEGLDVSSLILWNGDAIEQRKLAGIDTCIDGFGPNARIQDDADEDPFITVIGSYTSDENHYIGPQSSFHHAIVQCDGHYVGAFDISQPSTTPYTFLDPQPHKHPLTPQRLTRSKWIPINEGNGYISIWDPSTPSRVTNFRAVEEFYVQGHLCGNRYACFNPRWASEEEDVDCFQSIRLWAIEEQNGTARPVWTVRLPGHIVDVAVNEHMVACAYGSLISDENLDETHTTAPLLPPEDRVFGLQFRDIKDGSLLLDAPAFRDITDIICIALTRFYCVVTKAEGSNGGQAVLLVDLKSGDIVFEVELATMFIEGYGGLRISDCETYMLLWSSRNQLAVIDLEHGAWRLCERKVSDVAEEWVFGFWAVRRGRRPIGTRWRRGRGLLEVAWKATPQLVPLPTES
ncbi:hypothetical protein HDV00_006241 [Rhizophlyctis rosea]|nr:hypothetical protein HDV00_006241 [Rhizophlyctis rosea]